MDYLAAKSAAFGLSKVVCLGAGAALQQEVLAKGQVPLASDEVLTFSEQHDGISLSLAP